MEPEWLTFGKRLQAIASTGLHYAADAFDRERYEEVASIATAMLASLGGVPLARIEGLVPDFAQGYATPRVDVRGALIENDAILLVRERSDGRWALPGGFADVGLSAARNVEKEIAEEAGLLVKADRLYGIRHKAASDYAADVRDFYKLFFLCRRTGHGTARPGTETSDARFFARDDLPTLSHGRTIERDISAAFDFFSDIDRPALFD